MPCHGWLQHDSILATVEGTRFQIFWVIVSFIICRASSKGSVPLRFGHCSTNFWMSDTLVWFEHNSCLKDRFSAKKRAVSSIRKDTRSPSSIIFLFFLWLQREGKKGSSITRSSDMSLFCIYCNRSRKKWTYLLMPRTRSNLKVRSYEKKSFCKTRSVRWSQPKNLQNRYVSGNPACLSR